ncbi:MAG: hypothetical protein ACI4UU_05290 [Clostridia bacterium]
MKNKKLLSLIMVALIIALVMTALIIKNTQANSSESNIASNDEFINEIDDTNEIQSASENITEETDIAQEIIVLESDTETAPEAETTQVIQEEPKKITNTQEKKIESSKQTQQQQTIQTTTKQTSTQIQVQEQPKQETKTETKVQEPVAPKCSDGKHGVGVGNSNKWFNSYSEAISYYDNLINGYSNQVHSGAITAEEYNEKCPYGYETWSCPYCGKWTLNFYYR